MPEPTTNSLYIRPVRPGFSSPGPRRSLLPCMSAEEGRFDRSTQEMWQVENGMKMRILALVLLALLPVLAVAATYGTKPTIGKGTVTLLSSTIVGSQRTAADNTITTYKNTYSLTGALTGTAVS